jgi:hypothetical protein
MAANTLPYKIRIHLISQRSPETLLRTGNVEAFDQCHIPGGLLFRDAILSRVQYKNGRAMATIQLDCPFC